MGTVSWWGEIVGDVLRVSIRWAHAVAAVAWVGGSLFYLLALRPALSSTGADPRIEPAIAARFKEIVETSLVVLLVSGAVLTFDRLTSGAASVLYLAVLAAKVSLALGMCWLTWELGWTGRRRRPAARGGPTLARTPPAERAHGAVSRWLSPPRLTLLLGLGVVLLAVVLRELFEAGLRSGA
jgi:uncharacterized membrane protein